MTDRAAFTLSRTATPTIELFKGLKHNVTAVGAAVAQVPGTNLKHRTGIIIQNKHASNVVYVGGGIPYLFERRGVSEVYTDEDHDKRNLKWILSAGGTNEWYLATSAGGDPGLTEVTYLYYQTVGGAETLGTAGTVGALAAEHNWDWGDGDTLGWSTVYVRTNGALAANNPSVRYEHMLGYYFVLTADDTAATGGIELSAGASITMTVDGTVKIFAIASGASTPVGTLEFVHGK